MDASRREEPIALWCAEHLGSRPVELLHRTDQMSSVRGLLLEDGRSVAIKSRPDPTRRTPTCLRVQGSLSEAGFPCARPLTEVVFDGDAAVHAEEWMPGGEMLRGDDPETADRFGRLYARLMGLTAPLEVGRPPLPNPEWIDWAHGGPGHWAPNERHDARALGASLPPGLVAIAAVARERLLRPSSLPRVLGHADWETQNLRWSGGGGIHAVHDWDSVAWEREAALVGAASGSFSSAEVPTLAPIEGSRAFVEAYEEARGRRFDAEELGLAWAASLWPALHNARVEALYDGPGMAFGALMDQAEDRLRRF